MAGAELRCTQPTRLCSPGTNSSTACIEQKDRLVKSHLQSNVPRCPEQQNSRAPRWHHNLYTQHSLMAEGISPPGAQPWLQQTSDASSCYQHSWSHRFQHLVPFLPSFHQGCSTAWCTDRLCCRWTPLFIHYLLHTPTGNNGETPECIQELVLIR